jgi:hypothetical protein
MNLVIVESVAPDISTKHEEIIVIRSLASGNFVMTRHAYLRADGRTVYREDIQHVGYTADDCEHQGGSKFKVFGVDCDDESLAVVAVYDGETVVITVI